MSTQTLIINYPKLCEYLAQADQKDPRRDHSYLDLLKENAENNLHELLNGDTIALDIDHDRQEVSIFGKILEGEYYTLLDNLAPAQQEYHLLREAQDIARRRWIEKQIFQTLDERSAQKDGREYTPTLVDVEALHDRLPSSWQHIPLDRIVSVEHQLSCTDAQGRQYILYPKGVSATGERLRDIQVGNTDDDTMKYNRYARIWSDHSKIELSLEDLYDYNDGLQRKTIPVTWFVVEDITKIEIK